MTASIAVQTLGTTSILPRKLKDAEGSITSPGSAEIIDVLPPPGEFDVSFECHTSHDFSRCGASADP